MYIFPNFLFSAWRYLQQPLHNRAYRRTLGFSTLVAITTWITWLRLSGVNQAFLTLQAHWEIAVTMIFGSIVAGGTCMGGGAIAFPVLTKLLHVPSYDAKVFGLAIQSVGMMAATLTIVVKGLPVEWRIIRWTSLGGSLGIAIGILLLSSLLPPDFTKMTFTMMMSSFAIVLYRSHQQLCQPQLGLTQWRGQDRWLLIGVGFMGGIISGLMGTGIDIFTFSVMVLLFRLCATISTPTSVIVMAFNSVIGFGLHYFILNDFTPLLRDYWLAAVPIVVVGAPLGAILCSALSREVIIRLVIGLIILDLVSSLLFIPINMNLTMYCFATLGLFLAFYVWMFSTANSVSATFREPTTKIRQD